MSYINVNAKHVKTVARFFFLSYLTGSAALQSVLPPVAGSGPLMMSQAEVQKLVSK